MVFYILLFLFSCLFLFWSGSLLVGGLMRIAKFLGWKEFIVAFFMLSFATSIPNLFVGLSSALHNVSQLSFGDVMGSNMIDLTLAVALAAIVAKGIPAESRLIQSSAIFTVFTAILPLLLIYDGVLGRGDGLILILTYAFYNFWLFSKKERFTKVYDGKEKNGITLKSFKFFLKDIGKLFLGLAFLILAAEGIVRSATFFVNEFNFSLSFVGILIVGLGTAAPEIYFAYVSARKKETWLILGELMGSVIVVTTLVLGFVSLIRPIEIIDFSPFIIARLFLVVSAIGFLFCVRTHQKVTRQEAFGLILIYITFVLFQIFYK